MEYIFHGSEKDLHNLIDVFLKVLESNGVRIGRVKATFILMQFVDKAAAKKVLEKVEEASAGVWTLSDKKA